MKGHHNNIMMQSIGGFILFLIATQQFGTCNGQEKPLYNFPNLSNESVRQDFCTIHRLIEDGKIERRDALRGMNLRTVLLSYQLNAETGAIDEAYPDAAVKFLDELSRRAGFQWRNSYGVAESPKAELNETWTGFLLWAGSTYDLVGEYFIRTQERMELGALFSESWTDSSVIMVTQGNAEGESSSSFFNFLRPFTYGLWGLIGLTLVVTGFIYYLLDYFDSKKKGRNRDLGFKSSMFNAAWLFTGHTLHEPQSSATRLLVFSSSFLCLLTVAAYTANLVSFLLPKTDGIIINDISDVIRNDLSCCIDEASPNYDILTKDHPMVKLVPIKDSKWGHKTYHALAGSECDFLITDAKTFENHRRSSEYNPNCNLDRVGRNIYDAKGYFPVIDSSKLCSSVISEVLGLHMLEMKNDKTLTTIWENIYSRSATVFCKDAKEKERDKQRLSVANMYGVFVVYFTLLLIAILLTLYPFSSKPSEASEFLNDLRASITGHSVVSTQQLDITATASSGIGTSSVHENMLLHESRIKQLEENILMHQQRFWDKLERDNEERDRESMECIKKYLEKFEENMTKKLEENINKKFDELQNKINAIEKKQL